MLGVLDTRARARVAGNRLSRAGAAVIGLLVAFVLFGLLLVHPGPVESDLEHGLSVDKTAVGPSLEFPRGADRLRRDVLSRLAAAGRMSLLIACSATLIASTVGAAVGIVSGWYEGTRIRVPWPAVVGGGGAIAALGLGRPGLAAIAAMGGAAAAAVTSFRGPRTNVDGWLMRMVDVMLAFPFLLLVMAVGAALDRTTAPTIFVTLVVTGWMGIARVLRAKTMQVRSLQYIEASRAPRQSTWKLPLSHSLPTVAATLA